jgi:hypothetical protein
MIGSAKKRLKEKGINLIVELSVQAFLTDEGYDHFMELVHVEQS